MAVISFWVNYPFDLILPDKMLWLQFWFSHMPFYVCHNCGWLFKNCYVQLVCSTSISLAVQFDVTATSSWIKNEILWCAEAPGGAYGILSSFPSTWCGFPERSGAGWETSHRSPTTPMAPWQSCSDIRDEDVLSIHPLCSLMVGGDLTVLCSHRRVWLISSLLSCSFLLLLFGSPKSCIWSFTTLSKCLHGSALYKHTHTHAYTDTLFYCLVLLQWCLNCFSEVFQ